jgi:YVTN family beta-propeller protein
MLVFASILLSSFGILAQNAFADQVIAKIPVGSYPQDITVNPNTNRIYVSNNYGGALGAADSVSIIDGKNNTVVNTINFGVWYPGNPITSLEGIAVNPNTNMVYVAGSYTQVLYVIDGNTNAFVANITLNNFLGAIAVNPNTNKIYVTAQDHIFVIDGSTNKLIKDIQACGNVGGIAVNVVTNKIYESCNASAYKTYPGTHQVQVIDGTLDTVTGTIFFTELSPAGRIAISPITNTVYVESSNSLIHVINGMINLETDVINCGCSGGNMEVNQNTNKLYVANSDGNTVSVIDTTNNQVTDTLTVGTHPAALTVNAETNRIYAVNNGDWTVSVIDDNK